MYDPSPEVVNGLEPATRVRAIYLLNAFRAAGIPLMATSGRRTYGEQLKLVWEGKSKTVSSKHLTGRAFDVDVAGWSRDALPYNFWAVLWQYAEGLGLRAPLKTWDKGHFEY